MKKFLGLIVAAIMVFMQAVPAFAIMDKGDLVKGENLWLGAGYGNIYTWRIVEANDKNSDGKTDELVLLLGDNRAYDFEARPFDEASNEWNTSSVRRFLNSGGISDSNANFLEIFTDIEKSSMIPAELGDLVVLPTMSQVGTSGVGGRWRLSDADRKRIRAWWLRDKSDFTTVGGRYMDENGTLYGGGVHVNSKFGIMPVIRIKLDDVVFALPISDITDTGSMILSKVQTKAGDKKLVYRDNVGQSIAKATQSNAPMDELAPNQELDINYKDALVNTSNAVLMFGKTVVSSIISDKTTGNMLYYGVLGEFTNANPYDPASGTVKMKLPADFDKDNHEIKIYVEAIHTPSTHDRTNRVQNFTNYISDGVPLTYVAPTPPLPTQHTLTVDGDGSVGSSGTGSYAENASVPIYAGTKAGFDFDGWTYTTTPSSISLNVADITADRTTVTMPAGDVLMIANWEAITTTQHTLTVDGNGSVGSSGTGSYAENASVPIYAGTKAGFDFDGWTYTTTPSSISLNVADITADRTTVTMPVGDVLMIASWEASTPPIDPPPIDPPPIDPPPIDPPDPDEPTIPQIYNLVVEGNGSINSTGTGDYIESDTVHIYAGVREGYTFSHWTVSSASRLDVVDTRLDRITITMPANRVVMTANWIANSTGGDITLTNEPDTIPPMPQEPFAVEPPNTETSDTSSTGLAIGILFVCGMACGILGGMSYKKYKQDKEDKKNKEE